MPSRKTHLQIIGTQLKAARQLADIEQKQTANAAGMTTRTLHRIESASGTHSTEDERIARLVDVLEARGIVFLAPGEVSEGGFGIRLA